MTPDRRRALSPDPLRDVAGGPPGRSAAAERVAPAATAGGGLPAICGLPAIGGPADVEAAVADALAARRAGEVTGVLAVRLDRADLLAAAYGWGVVDDLVADVAGRLRQTVRTDDRLVPLDRGGLCLVARAMPGQRDVALLAERVVRAAARPRALPDGVEHEVTVSVGAAVGRHGDQPASLLARAERRCRGVADAGGDRWSVEPVGSYAEPGTHGAGNDDPDRAVRDAALARLRQGGELRQTLAADGLDVALTPLVPLSSSSSSSSDLSGGTAGAGDGEWRVAAVRWRHPVRGLLHPGAVVAAVVDAGLAGAYLETVLRLVSAEALDASVAAGRPVGVAVDLPLAVAAQAGAQGADLVRLLTGAVARARIEPGQLAIRVTFDDARTGGEVLAPTLEQLAALGITAMVTGVDPSPGTLAWLDGWPLAASVWWLDPAVAAGLAPDRRDGPAPELAPTVILARAGAAAVVAAATARGVLTGAEGVDDPAVAAELAAAGVRLAGGRWTTRPAPAAGRG